MLDLNNAKDAKFAQHLRDDLIIWLSSVRPDGRPHLVPVWFYWDGSQLIIFSKPDFKIRNLQKNNTVILGLETVDQGEEVYLIEGKAELVDRADLKPTLPAYAQKYAGKLQSMNWTPESMAESYTQTIVVTPTKIHNWS
jgi:PPOX class probable F420-dependent enzyme